MTAEQLVSGLRERGFTVLRATSPGWVLVPRIKAEDPMAAWLGKKGAIMRPFQPESHTRPEQREYEASIQTIAVSDENGPQAIWEAAKP